MEDKQTMCLTMCLCYSSASEDLGCRRGDFSRKHYGSVELVSPTHDPLICSLLSVSGRDCLLIPFLLPPFLCLYLFCWHVWITEGGLMSHDTLGVVQWCALPGCIALVALLVVMRVFAACSASKVNLLCFDAAAQCVSLWLITELLSHCCFGGVCVWVCVPPLWAGSVHPDNPQAQEVLGLHSTIILPTRDILRVCLSTVYYVCRRLVLRRNHMLPISTSRLSLHTVLLGVF